VLFIILAVSRPEATLSRLRQLPFVGHSKQGNQTNDLRCIKKKQTKKHKIAEYFVNISLHFFVEHYSILAVLFFLSAL